MTWINFTIDLYGCMVCFILLQYLLFGNMDKKKNRLFRYFLLMTICCLGINVGDIPKQLCQGLARPWYPAALWTGSLMLWLSSVSILLFFTGYLIEFLSPRVKVDRRFWYVVVILYALNVAGIILSIFNGMYFNVTPENYYQRGSLFWYSQVIAFLVYLVNIMIFITYRRSLNRKDFIVLFSYITLPMTAELIQSLNFGTAFLGAGVMAGVLFIFINLQIYKELQFERQEKDLTEQRLDIMLSQIQPHFLYNVLTTIRGLCGEESRIAKETITEFSHFLRGNMRFLKSKAPIPFEQELLHVKSYLALEQQRFQSKLKIVYDIRVMEFLIPPLTIQPIVENAVRHGVLRRERGGTVTLKTEETDLAYLVIISDDGVGLQHSKNYSEEFDEHEHIGIENVRNRIFLLCKGSIEIQSEPDKGTIATITIPKEVW